VKRIYTPPEVLRQESHWIIQFCLSELKVSDGVLKVADAYLAYKDWVEANGGKSQISIDGFGRMLPKTYGRFYTTIDGENYRMIRGVELSK